MDPVAIDDLIKKWQCLLVKPDHPVVQGGGQATTNDGDCPPVCSGGDACVIRPEVRQTAQARDGFPRIRCLQAVTEVFGYGLSFHAVQGEASDTIRKRSTRHPDTKQARDRKPQARWLGLFRAR